MLDPADFALQEQPEDILMVAIFRVWYNGSYTMAAKPITFLELHYTLIQFLINPIYIQQIISTHTHFLCLLYYPFEKKEAIRNQTL